MSKKAQPIDDLKSEKEVAEILGVSPSTMRNLRDKKKTKNVAPHIRLGRRVLYDLPVLFEWLKSKRRGDWKEGAADPSDDALQQKIQGFSIPDDAFGGRC